MLNFVILLLCVCVCVGSKMLEFLGVASYVLEFFNFKNIFPTKSLQLK
jgi:hypothetical protein